MNIFNIIRPSNSPKAKLIVRNKKIPENSGCYIMKDKDENIIYIGKAKNIKKRVLSYFSGFQNTKTTEMIKNINDIEFIITDNEVEALLLEAKLIFEKKPKYNLDLKESIRYSYIKITNDDFPKIISVKEVDRKKDLFFGPYPNGIARQELISFLNKTFQLRVCKKLPKKLCLLYSLGYCSGPCENKISKKEYNKNIKMAVAVLKGKTNFVIKKLKNEMSLFSKQKNYEQAKIKRDQINAILQSTKKQKISLKKSYNQDFINFIELKNKIKIQVFNVTKGLLGERKKFEFDCDFENNYLKTFFDFIRYYYYSNTIPEEIILPIKINNSIQGNLIQYLSKLKGTKVKITNPVIGSKKKLLDLLYKNIELDITLQDDILFDLQNVLNLENLPKIIECFDISNLGEKFTVGSMVYFKNGKPDKKNYRKFKIKTVLGQDDFSMIGEIVYRRYFRLKEENLKYPDLIIIDGGKGQLNSATSKLKELNLDIPIISLAKKEEVIYFPNKIYPLILPHTSKALNLIIRCRNEAHRFGLNYHKLLRSKGMFK